jgi:hypothetical protein
MISIVRFEREHAKRMCVQRQQLLDEFGEADAMSASFGDAWTALLDGRPIACAGVVEVWSGRAYAWALLAEDAGPHMLAITRAIRCFLQRAPYRRIEMAVTVGFDAGRRWAEMLGFQLETPTAMRNYLPNGKDAWLYARVNDRGSGIHDRQCGDGVRRERLPG